jgi:hypothetical protein
MYRIPIRWIGSIVAFLTVFTAVGPDTMAIEKAKYSILAVEKEFELRQYGRQIIAETFVAGDFETAGNEGFQRLFKYISGYNVKAQSIEMTSPVTQGVDSVKIAMTAPVGQENKNGRWRITFLMPSEYTLETLPQPLDERIRLTQDTGRLMAAIKYSGRWSKKLYDENKARLDDYIQKRRLTFTAEPIWARYDPPFMPWFLRRNEILIPVE